MEGLLSTEPTPSSFYFLATVLGHTLLKSVFLNVEKLMDNIQWQNAEHWSHKVKEKRKSRMITV